MAKIKVDPQPEFTQASDRPPIVSVEHYPYKVVAKIAARLLNGDDYAAAAKRAIALIAACQHELSERQRKAEIMNRARGNARDMDSRTLKRNGQPFQMSWREAYEYITGQEREERALPLLRKYFAYVHRHNEAQRLGVQFAGAPETPDNLVAKWINKMRKDGMSTVPALKHKDNFAAWRASAK